MPASRSSTRASAPHPSRSPPPRDEDVDVIGLSILSGSHMELIPEVISLVRAEGVTAPVFVGGIIPAGDREALIEAGVAAVFTPKDFELVEIMDRIAELAVTQRG
ncbi:MAG: cobalamin-dependent protein [Microthrixaceae bacterium]|nr:cobalamin-dependent protein [Microthrixaceae bacterium]